MATDAPRRWVYAHLAVLGDVVFETSDAYSEGSVEARRMCLLRVSRNEAGVVVEKNVTRLPAYGHGIVSDPIILGESSFIMACMAPKEMAEAARSAWSDIVIPNNGRFPGKGA